MQYELNIALRYLLSRKSHGAVNIISAVAMAGVAVAAAAMVVVLSVFNGFAALVESKTSFFNPPYMAVADDGDIVADADSMAAVSGGFPMIDEQAFAISPLGNQMPINFRALPQEALNLTGVDRIFVDGSVAGSQNPTDWQSAIISVGVAMQLNLHVGDSIRVVVPRRLGRVNPGAPMRTFRETTVPVAAIYQVEQEQQDRDMILLPLDKARELLSYATEATSLAFFTSDAPELSPSLRVLDRHAQEADSFRMIAIEKWITFLMLAFILVIASFNVVSTLSLMIVEKQANMGVLRAMGASSCFIRNIFANQAWLITLCGGAVGIILGSLLILGQQHYGWVPLSTSNLGMLTVNAYPVLLSVSDLVVCAATLVLLAGALTIIGRRLPTT